MLNRKELFHRDLPSEEQKTNTHANSTESNQPVESNVIGDTRYIRNPRPRILSNDFVGTQNNTGSNRRNLITDPSANINLNRRGGSQKKDNCNTVKIVKGKSLAIRSEKEVMDGKYKEIKPGSNNNQNTKASNDSDGSADSNKKLKFIKDLATPDENGKTKAVLPGSSCCKKRPNQNPQNAQVKLVSNLDGPTFNQLFSNTENRADSKLDSNLPAVNELQNK